MLQFAPIIILKHTQKNQFQSNMYIVEQITSFLYEMKFSRLHEKNLSLMQNNNNFPIAIETLET